MFFISQTYSINDVIKKSAVFQKFMQRNYEKKSLSQKNHLKM